MLLFAELLILSITTVAYREHNAKKNGRTDVTWQQCTILPKISFFAVSESFWCRHKMTELNYIPETILLRIKSITWYNACIMTYQFVSGIPWFSSRPYTCQERRKVTTLIDDVTLQFYEQRYIWQNSEWRGVFPLLQWRYVYVFCVSLLLRAFKSFHFSLAWA